MAELYFGDFRFCTRRLELIGPDGPVELRARARELLLRLIENRHRFVSKQELLETVWGGVHVADSSVPQCISELRHALGDDPKEPAYIETVIKGGYRFIAPLYHKPTERLEPMPWSGSAARDPARETVPYDQQDSSPAREPARFPLTLRGIALLALVVAVVSAGVSAWVFWPRGGEEDFGTLWVPAALAADQESSSLAAAEAFDRLAPGRLGSALGVSAQTAQPTGQSGAGWLVEYQVSSTHGLRLETRVTLRRWPAGEERWGWSWSGPADSTDLNLLTEDLLTRLVAALERQN